MEYSLVRLGRKPETNMELSYICYLFIELCVCVSPPGNKQQKPLFIELCVGDYPASFWEGILSRANMLVSGRV